MAKLPAFQFYPGDWMKDPGLRSCSYAARGLWLDMLCLMFECDRRGYLQLHGKPLTTAALARMTGGAEDEVSRLLQELESSGVFSRTAHGMIYSRRQVREEAKRQKCVEAGKLGGNPTLIRQSKGGPKGQSKGDANPQTTPSSSSSTSVKDKDNERENAGASERAVGPAPPNEGESLIPEIYRVYPRKEAPRAAMKAIREAIARVRTRHKGDDNPGLAAAAWILERVRVYASSPIVTTNKPKYIPHPKTWFNQDRFDDDPIAWQHDRSSGERSAGGGVGGAGGGHPGQAGAGGGGATRGDREAAARARTEHCERQGPPDLTGPTAGVLRARVRRGDGDRPQQADAPEPDRTGLAGRVRPDPVPAPASGAGAGAA